MDQATAQGLTVGVEEEFLLVDPARGTPVASAPQVLAVAAASAGPVALHGELLATQVEAATGVCTTLAELGRQLRHGRSVLADAARAEGLLLVSSGVPVLGGAAPASSGPRFDRIVAAYAGVVADYQACGCHVHVGVPDRDTAVAVLNHLRPWLPTLLALSGNSPLCDGVDTGYQSWRMVQQSRFPGSGLPPRFASAAAYDAELARLVDCGVLVDASMSFWLARPSSHLPTVELRVADAAATVDHAVLQAALARALVRTALAELAAGREAAPARDGEDQVAAAAVWCAARYGPHGPAVRLPDGRPVPAVVLVHELVEHVAAALDDTGDLALVRRGVAAVLTRGTGADHQRRDAAGGPLAVIGALAERTMESGCATGTSGYPDQAMAGSATAAADRDGRR